MSRSESRIRLQAFDLVRLGGMHDRRRSLKTWPVSPQGGLGAIAGQERY